MCRSSPRCATRSATIWCASAPAEVAKTKAAEIAATLKGAPRLRGGREEGGARGEDRPSSSPAGRRCRTSAPAPRSTASRSRCRKGGVSDPISTPQGTAIVRVVEKEDVTDAQIAAGRDQLREELAQPAARSVLQRLHAEGEEEPEDRDPKQDMLRASSAQRPRRAGAVTAAVSRRSRCRVQSECRAASLTQRGSLARTA